MTYTDKNATNRNTRQRLATEEGFTLMEVLIAISILAVGLLAIASMQIAAIQTTGGAKAISKGVLWAEDRMEYFSSLPYNHTALSAGTGKADPLGSPAGYTLTYSVTNNDPKPQCKRITITVRWAEKGVTKTTTLTGVKPQL